VQLQHLPGGAQMDHTRPEGQSPSPSNILPSRRTPFRPRSPLPPRFEGGYAWRGGGSRACKGHWEHPIKSPERAGPDWAPNNGHPSSTGIHSGLCGGARVFYPHVAAVHSPWPQPRGAVASCPNLEPVHRRPHRRLGRGPPGALICFSLDPRF